MINEINRTHFAQSSFRLKKKIRALINTKAISDTNSGLKPVEMVANAII